MSKETKTGFLPQFGQQLQILGKAHHKWAIVFPCPFPFPILFPAPKNICNQWYIAKTLNNNFNSKTCLWPHQQQCAKLTKKIFLVQNNIWNTKFPEMNFKGCRIKVWCPNRYIRYLRCSGTKFIHTQLRIFYVGLVLLLRIKNVC